MNAVQRYWLVAVPGSLLIACAQSPGDTADVPADTVATAPAAADASADAALAKFAGTWTVRAWNSDGDTIPTHTIVATADRTGWRQTFTDRDDIPLRVIDASGDLAVFEAGPYESVLRAGVQVSVVFTMRVNGNTSIGELVAHYDGASGPASIMRGRTEGSRQP